MKRYIAIIAALLCVATTSQAQELIWGVKAGLNISSAGLHGNDIEGRNQYRSPRFGFSGGLTTEYKFKKPMISIGAEVLYSQQGVKYKYLEVPTGGEATVTHRYSYINVPLLFNYYFVDNFPISFNLGIQPGFMVSENSSTKYTNGSVSEEWNYAYGWDVDYPDTPNGNGYYMFDLSVPIGLTYTLSNKIYFDVRYCIGVLNIFDEASDPEIDRDFKSTNNNCTISIGYKF